MIQEEVFRSLIYVNLHLKFTHYDNFFRITIRLEFNSFYLIYPDFTETLRVLLLISLLKYAGLTDAVLKEAFNKYKYVYVNRSLLEN